MRKLKFVSMVLLLALVLSGGLSAAMAWATDSQVQPPDGWTTFTHPEFGFSFFYPADWHLENYLSLEEPSGTVSIASTDPEALEPGKGIMPGVKKINIGLHLVEWDEPITPREWVNAYSEAASKLIGHADSQVIEITDLDVGGYPAVRKIATSPLLTYDVVTIKRGNVMWFIWSNAEHQCRETFEQLVRSFQWENAKLPLTLQSLNFEPTVRLDLSEKVLTPPSTLQMDEQIEQKEGSVVPKGIPGEPPGYRMPFDGGYYITAGPGGNCGSPYHTGSAGGAIDFGTPNGTYIRNSSTGTVHFNGWDNSGYGNLIQVRDSSNRVAYYAHLSSRTSKSVGSSIAQSSWVGNSGKSGCGDCGYHLHFHVRTDNWNPVDITGIPVMTWYGDGCTGFPDGWAQYTP
jgi:hypothetical protein